MSSVIPFLPSNIVAPTFLTTLDGTDYKVVITWNVSAQRFYINIYNQGGLWMLTTPLVQSPPARAVASVTYDIQRRILTVEMVDPSLWPVPLSRGGLATPFGTMIDYTLEGFQPDTYNGTFRALTVDETTFSFPMANDPGQAVVLGNVNRAINMIEGVFTISSMIYRNGAFEINP